MKRALLALILVASPAFAQATNGWAEIQNGWGEIQTPPGFTTIPPPASATLGCVGVFLGSPLHLQCAPASGLVYATTTKSLDVTDGRVQAGNLRAIPLPASGSVTVTNQGTAGATTYTYSVQACLADGSCNAAGPASTTTTGNATLSATNFNRLSWSAVPGSALYKIRRDVGGASTGVIWSGTATTVDDTGLAGDSSAKPTVDGTGMVTASAVRVGANPPTGDDSAVLLSHSATTPLASGGAHAVRDEGTYLPGSAVGGYASYDSFPTMSGTVAQGHLHSFQSRPKFTGTAGMGAVRGFTFQPYGTWSGAIGQAAGLYVADSAGTGTITLQAAIYVEALTKGASNYVIYANGPTPSYHGGIFQTGAAVTAAGIVSGSNVKTITAQNSVKLGVSAGTLGYFNTYLGDLVANSATDSAMRNVCVGTRAGNAIVANDDNVFVGYNAGYYETGSAKLIIDNVARANESDARLKALLYGVFGADTADQVLTINAAKVRLPYLPVYADNAAATGGGLVAGDVYRTSTGVLMVTY